MKPHKSVMISLQRFPQVCKRMTLERLIPFLAKAIKNRREEIHMSHANLADATGLSPEYLAFVEEGQTNFSMKTLSTVADALGVPPSRLIEDAEQMAGVGIPGTTDGTEA